MRESLCRQSTNVHECVVEFAAFVIGCRFVKNESKILLCLLSFRR